MAVGVSFTTWIAVGLTVASAYYSQRQAKKMRAKMEAEADKQKGFMVVSDNPSEPLPVVYGKARVAGSRVFVKTKNSVTPRNFAASNTVFLESPINIEKFIFLSRIFCCKPFKQSI